MLKAALSGKLPYAISPLIALEYEGKIHQKIEEGFLKNLNKRLCENFERLIRYGLNCVGTPSDKTCSH